MALSKTIDTDFGVPATYWWITMSLFQTVSPTEMKGFVQISGYASKEVRDKGGTWLRQYAKEISVEEFATLMSTSRDDFVSSLKSGTQGLTPEQTSDYLYQNLPYSCFYSGLAAGLYNLFIKEKGGLLEGAEWVE